MCIDGRFDAEMANGTSFVQFAFPGRKVYDTRDHTLWIKCRALLATYSSVIFWIGAWGIVDWEVNDGLYRWEDHLRNLAIGVGLCVASDSLYQQCFTDGWMAPNLLPRILQLTVPPQKAAAGRWPAFARAVDVATFHLRVVVAGVGSALMWNATYNLCYWCPQEKIVQHWLRLPDPMNERLVKQLTYTVLGYLLLLLSGSLGPVSGVPWSDGATSTQWGAPLIAHGRCLIKAATIQLGQVSVWFGLYEMISTYCPNKYSINPWGDGSYYVCTSLTRGALKPMLTGQLSGRSLTPESGSLRGNFLRFYLDVDDVTTSRVNNASSTAVATNTSGTAVPAEPPAVVDWLLPPGYAWPPPDWTKFVAIAAVGLAVNFATRSLIGSAFLDKTRGKVTHAAGPDKFASRLSRATLYGQCVLAYAGAIAHYSGAWLVLDSLWGYHTCSHTNVAPTGAPSCSTRNWLYTAAGAMGLLVLRSAGSNVGVETRSLLASPDTTRTPPSREAAATADDQHASVVPVEISMGGW